MLELLLGACGGEEEVRGVVAECLGHTALLAPAPVLAVLRARLSDPSPAVRAVVAASPRGMVVRFWLHEPPLLVSCFLLSAPPSPPRPAAGWCTAWAPSWPLSSS